MSFQNLSEMLPLLVPLFILELGLMVLALRDLVKREHVRFDNKIVWGIVIVLLNLLGPIVYFVVGREEA